MAANSLSMSYAVLPSLSSICKLGGGEDEYSYLPYWSILRPPSELLDLIFPSFRRAEEVVNKVRVELTDRLTRSFAFVL